MPVRGILNKRSKGDTNVKLHRNGQFDLIGSKHPIALGLARGKCSDQVQQLRVDSVGP